MSYRVSDYGFDVVITCVRDGTAVDVSGASTKTIKVTDPDGNTSSQTATFTTDGTDGKIQYTMATGILDEKGKWKVAPLVLDGSTFQFEGEPIDFRVFAQL